MEYGLLYDQSSTICNFLFSELSEEAETERLLFSFVCYGKDLNYEPALFSKIITVLYAFVL
jgi:hypothetical protein